MSLKPSESEMKSLISAIDNAFRLEPCGADAFGAPSKELYWHLQDMGHLLQPARRDAGGASLVFLHLLEGEAECGTQLLLAHCKHLAAHPHPRADVLVDGIRGHLSRQIVSEPPWLTAR